MKWLLIVVPVLVLTIALYLALTAQYSEGQEAPPAIDPTMIAALPTVFPQVLYHNPYDLNYSGAVNIVDVFLVAKHIGETSPPPVCGWVILPGLYVDLLPC